MNDLRSRVIVQADGQIRTGSHNFPTNITASKNNKNYFNTELQLYDFFCL